MIPDARAAPTENSTIGETYLLFGRSAVLSPVCPERILRTVAGLLRKL
jgi:hypothetical protein